MIKTEAYVDSKQFLSLTRKNGVKAGTLYSMKPTDGAGDFVWDRNSPAYRMGQDGVMELMGVNIPRVDYTNTCPELLIEKQSTNNFLRSNQLNTSPNITGTVTYTSSTELDPTGANEGWLVTDADAGDIKYFIGQTFSFTSGVNNVISMCIKKTGTPTFYPAFELSSNSGANIRAIINTQTGAINTALSSAGVAIVRTFAKTLPNDYLRVSICFNFTAGSSLLLYCYPAASLNGTSLSASATGSTGYWQIGIEQGDYPTSIIPTTSAAVTRLKDIAYDTTIDFTTLKGTIFIRARIFSSTYSKVDTLFSLNDNDVALENFITCSTNASRTIFIETYGNGTDSNAYSYSLPSDGIYSIAIGYDFSGANNLLNIAINGELKLFNDTQVNGPPIALNRLDLGSLFGTLTQVDNRIIGQMYFADQLSDTDIVNLTA